MLARFDRRVIAVDQSPGMLEALAERAVRAGVANRVEPVAGDMESLPLADGEVDAAFLSQVLHHTVKPQAALEEVVRILRSGGTLVVWIWANMIRNWFASNGLITGWALQWKIFVAGWWKLASSPGNWTPCLGRCLNWRCYWRLAIAPRKANLKE